MTERLSVGDYFKVVEAHYNMREGSTWRVDDVVPHEQYCGSEFPECGCEDTATVYYSSSTDGTRSGFEAEASKVKKLTENIPFSISAEVVIEVTGTIYASSEAEAIQKARSSPDELVDNQSESYTYARNVYLAEV